MLDNRERDELLVQAIRQGQTYSEIADVAGITRQRVQQIAKRAGVVCSSSYAKLTVEEKRHIRREFKRGVLASHILIDGKKRRGTYDYLVREGLHIPQNKAPRWTVKEDNYVKKHYATKFCCDIGEHLGRTKNEVIGRARRLGILSGRANEPLPSLTIEGVTRSVAEWSDHAGIRYGTLNLRLKRGWDAKEAVFLPVSPYNWKRRSC